LPPSWPDDLDVVTSALGAVLALLGALLVLWAVRELGHSFTPFPMPRDDGRLVATGPFVYVRHPIYAGGILFALGFALATSPAALVPTVGLALLWTRKAAREEEQLSRRFPEYADYRSRVPGRFLPSR
jgi:protein-S-isoprenylcysteine O-methyltransferase Ste14